MASELQFCNSHTGKFRHVEGHFWDHTRHFLERRIAEGYDRECHIGKSTDEQMNGRFGQTVICEDAIRRKRSIEVGDCGTDRG